MTFLELCQRVRQESGISGAGPVSVLNQKSILEKVVQWVKQADLDIQRLQSDWLFMWRMSNVQITQNVREYDALTLGLGNMGVLQSLDIDGDIVRYCQWQHFKEAGYLQATQQGGPTVYTVKPDGLLVMYPTPDKNYTATAEYSIAPQPLVNDDDVSPVPAQYHDIILHKALMYYASHEEDNSLYQVSAARYEAVLSELASEYLPRISFTGGIA